MVEHDQSVLWQQRRLLVVEDDLDLAELMLAWLEGQGIEADHAIDGLQAIERLLREEYAAVICDLRMPGMDGVSVLRWLVQHRPNLPRMVLSTFSGPIVMPDGSPLALTARFQKPLDRAERERLLVVLRKQFAPDP